MSETDGWTVTVRHVEVQEGSCGGADTAGATSCGLGNGAVAGGIFDEWKEKTAGYSVMLPHDTVAGFESDNEADGDLATSGSGDGLGLIEVGGG